MPRKYAKKNLKKDTEVVFELAVKTIKNDLAFNKLQNSSKYRGQLCVLTQGPSHLRACWTAH